MVYDNLSLLAEKKRQTKQLWNTTRQQEIGLVQSGVWHRQTLH